MDCKLINLDSSIDLELLNKLENNHLSNRLYLEYQNEYHKFKGKNKCFQVSFKNETYNFCFNSSGEKDNSRVSYYNNPVGIDIINNNYDNYINAHNNFIKEIKSNILREIFLEKIILPEELNKYLKDFQFNNNLIEIFEKTIIDLNVNEKLIFKNFSKGHKSNIKKKDDLEYQIINHINYKKNSIHEMKLLHETVSNKKTRSDFTWTINEKMILCKQGFLIFVKKDKKLISANFFYHNGMQSNYFSSCTIREYFKKYHISHKVIWKAIEYLKKIKVNTFILGRSKTIKSKRNIDEKELNVEKFKKSFGGYRNIILTYLLK